MSGDAVHWRLSSIALGLSGACTGRSHFFIFENFRLLYCGVKYRMGGTLTVSVTRAHIAAADAVRGVFRRDSLEVNCPVAFALRMAGKPVRHVLMDHVSFWDGTEAPLPESAREFVRRYDDKLSVKPFEFELA